MKKSIITLGLAAMCTIVLAGCAKEIIDTQDNSTQAAREYIPFTVTLSLDATKTETDADLKVSWTLKDTISLFHAEAGTTDFVNDGMFIIKEAGSNGVFEGALAQALDPAKSYDWYAMYPWKESNTNPKEINFKFREDWQSRAGSPSNGGTENLSKMPLYSSVKGLAAAESVNFAMHQFYALAKITMTNVNFSSSLAINNFGISYNRNINSDPKDADMPALYGDFDADITGETAVVSPTGSTPRNIMTNFNGKGYTIPKGESRTHYLAVYPGTTLPAGRLISFHTQGAYENSLQVRLSQDITFNAGKVTVINVNLDKENYFITEEEMAEPIMFRCCLNGDKDDPNNRIDFMTTSWTRTVKPVFFSTLDHKKGISSVYVSTYGLCYHYGRAFIGTSCNFSGDNSASFANSDSYGRYFLIGCDPSKGVSKNCYVTVNANYAKIPAGKSVAFYSSIYVKDNAAASKYSFEYSLDGGSTYKKAKVAVFGNDTCTDNTVEFSYAKNFACHPIIIETEAAASDLANAKVIFRIKQTETGSFMAFAPYYEYNEAEGFRSYSKYKKSTSNPQAAAWEYVKTATWDNTSETHALIYPGDYEDITGCCYLKVAAPVINVNGGIDDWTQGDTISYISKK